MSHTINTTDNQKIIQLINKVLGIANKDYNIAYRPWDDSYTVRFLGQKKVRGYLTVNDNNATFEQIN